MNFNRIPVWLLKAIAMQGCIRDASLRVSESVYAKKLLNPMQELGLVHYDYSSECWQLTERGCIVLEIMNLPAADRPAALLVLGLIPPEFDPTTTQTKGDSNGNNT